MNTTTPTVRNDAPCASCKLRARYEKNPRSWLGRLWRWHTRWCPGWKNYLAAMPEEEAQALRSQLGL